MASKKLQLSNKQCVEEFLKCGKDPKYFIRNYCRIAHPHQGLVLFKLWGFQEDLLDKFLNNKNNILLKSRQLGASTTVAAFCLWLMLFHREKNILVLAINLETAQNLVQKSNEMFKNLPDFFQKLATLRFDNKRSFQLSNGSKIRASPTTESAGRSEALSLLVIDEAAHVDNISTIWAAIGPAVQYGKVIALSTPNGLGGWFYDQYVKGEHGTGEFVPTKLDWRVHPDRDDAWMERERKKYPRKYIEQEYNCLGGDTRIYTMRGFIPIKDIKVGDFVLTHKQRFKQVTETMKRKAFAFKVNTYLNRKHFFITAEHPILSNEYQWIDFIDMKDKLFCARHDSANNSVDKKFVFDKFLDIIPHKDEIDVYNISVEDDESYITEHAVMHNCSFLASGDTVIDAQDIARISDLTVAPSQTIGLNKSLWLWEMPQPQKQYLISADAARGDGEDFSAFHIFDPIEKRQIGEFKDQIAIDIFSQILFDVGEMFNEAIVVIENNGPGWETCNKMLEKNYQNLYFTKKGTGEYVPHYKYSYLNSDIVPGFTTSLKNRYIIILRFEELIRNKKTHISSARMIEEIKTFIWKNGRPEAQSGKHDDLIMSYCIGLEAIDQIYETDEKSQNFKKKAIDCMIKFSNANQKFNTAIPGDINYHPQKSIFAPKTKKYQDLLEQQKKLAWIFKG